MPINTVLIVALLGAMLAPIQSAPGPDAEGFIRDWLVLAPIAIEGESGADQIDKDFIAGEAAANPKAGDKVSVGGNQLTWTPHKSADYYIDFLAAFLLGWPRIFRFRHKLSAFLKGRIAHQVSNGKQALIAYG